MSYDAARAFNHRCPPGAQVEVVLRGGGTRSGRTRGPAIVWAGYALIEIEGWPGYWTVEAVRPLDAAAAPGGVALRPSTWTGARAGAVSRASPTPARPADCLDVLR